MKKFKGLKEIIKALDKTTQEIRKGTTSPSALEELREQALEWAIEYREFKQELARPTQLKLEYYSDELGRELLFADIRDTLKYETKTPAVWFLNIALELGYTGPLIDEAIEFTKGVDWDCTDTINDLFNRAALMINASALQYTHFQQELKNKQRKYKYTAIIEV